MWGLGAFNDRDQVKHATIIAIKMEVNSWDERCVGSGVNWGPTGGVDLNKSPSVYLVPMDLSTSLAKGLTPSTIIDSLYSRDFHWIDIIKGTSCRQLDRAGQKHTQQK
mmetsp:Transcript_13968/g.21060  ORF Transcript_13968/g.21060 Transcript_13968/m.21060 type:complete len:108 (-) Transcript_13968:286-609(-)